MLSQRTYLDNAVKVLCERKQRRDCLEGALTNLSRLINPTNSPLIHDRSFRCSLSLLPLDLSRVSRGCQTCLLGNELARCFGPRCRFVALAYTLTLAETQAIVKDGSMAWRLLRGRTRGLYTSSMPARRYIYCYCWNHTKPLASILHGLDYIQGYQGNI